MKKTGFTLVELIITLTVIGIGAALMVPALTKLMPDKDKIQVIRYNTLLSNAVAELLNDEAIYYTPTDDNQEAICEGLECTQTPLISPYNTVTYSGNNKLKNLLIKKLGLDSSNMLPDGSAWTITTTIPATVTINLDGKNATCRSYSMSTTSGINCFSFKIDKNGGVTGNDPLTQSYLSNPLDMHSKKEDYQNADSFVDDD